MPCWAGEVSQGSASGFSFRCLFQNVQLASWSGILGHLLVPFVLRPVLQRGHQLSAFMSGKLVNSRFDFGNALHEEKL